MFCIPRPSKGCFLKAFKYLKTINKHPLEGAGMFFFIIALQLSFFSPSDASPLIRAGWPKLEVMRKTSWTKMGGLVAVRFGSRKMLQKRLQHFLK